MPKKLSPEQRKSKLVAFRVKVKTYKIWDDLLREYVGFGRQFESPEDLFLAMADSFSKSLQPKARLG